MITKNLFFIYSHQCEVVFEGVGNNGLLGPGVVKEVDVRRFLTSSSS